MRALTCIERGETVLAGGIPDRAPVDQNFKATRLGGRAIDDRRNALLAGYLFPKDLAESRPAVPG